MPFRKPTQQPEFADLKGILAQVKTSHPAIYQTVAQLIDRLTRFRLITIEEVADINSSINDINSVTNITADKYASYLTALDESIRLPNSNQLLAGTGITLDYSVPNRATISANAGAVAFYDSPLTDGDIDETELIFSMGDCIIVQVPIP